MSHLQETPTLQTLDEHDEAVLGEMLEKYGFPVLQQSFVEVHIAQLNKRAKEANHNRSNEERGSDFPPIPRNRLF